MSKTVFGLVKGNIILLNFLFTAFKNSMKTFLLAPKTFLKNHKIHNTVYKKPHEDCHACADATFIVSHLCSTRKRAGFTKLWTKATWRVTSWAMDCFAWTAEENPPNGFQSWCNMCRAEDWKQCTIGWSDLALFAISEIGLIAADQVHFCDELISKKSANFTWDALKN